MLERVSALAGIAPFESDGIRMADAPEFTLTQVVGDAKTLKIATGKLPDAVGTTIAEGTTTILCMCPNQFWLVNDSTNPISSSSPRRRGSSLSDSRPGLELDYLLHGNDGNWGIVVTPLSSSRSRIALEGPRSREVLAKCSAIDFHLKIFTPGQFVITGIHHMPGLIHRVSVDGFHLYVMRTFAQHLWEVLVDAAHS